MNQNYLDEINLTEEHLNEKSRRLRKESAIERKSEKDWIKQTIRPILANILLKKERILKVLRIHTVTESTRDVPIERSGNLQDC